jgi:hypothetical protein
MSSFETQPSSVQLDAITDDVDETESFPEQGFANAGFEMVEVIDSCPRIKVRNLLREDTTQSKG